MAAFAELTDHYAPYILKHEGVDKEEGMLLRLERERRLEALAQCPEGHDTRHYYSWLDDIDKKDAEIAKLKDYAQAQEDKYEFKIASLQARIKELNRINIAIQESWDDCKTTADRLRGIIKEHDRTIHYGIVTLKERINELEVAYHELIFAVSKKFEGETRHETALRYIVERENNQDNIAKAVLVKKLEGNG